MPIPGNCNSPSLHFDLKMVYLFIFGQISLPQSPRQETFWASVGFESTEESVTLSDAPRRLATVG